MCPTDKLTDQSFNETIEGYRTLINNCYLPRMNFLINETECQEVGYFNNTLLSLLFVVIIVVTTEFFGQTSFYSQLKKSEKWYKKISNYFFIAIISTFSVAMAAFITFGVKFQLFC